MRFFHAFTTVGLLSLAACGRSGAPVPERSDPVARTAPGPAASAPIVPAPLSPPADFTLPDDITALGTEPFWSARISGNVLTYVTPEDQVGRPVPVTRTAGAGFVDFQAMLGGQALGLQVSAGPCSDGMSDAVYPLSVVRRLGDDEQRGCARASQSKAKASGR